MARRPTIYVEGKNDLFALVNLLIRHGINYDHKPWPIAYPEFHAAVSDSTDESRDAMGIDALLTMISDEVRIQAGRTVGFVLDADEFPVSRWQAVRDRLQECGVETEGTDPQEIQTLQTIPEQGFIGRSRTFEARVGVWLMPDNQNAGALEHFLESLIPNSGDGENSLFTFAKSCTATANAHHGALIREVDSLKANLACWLAWQSNPGRPYGTAIRARYFQHESPTALQFVDWFRRLFQIQP